MVDPLSYFSFQPVLHNWFNNWYMLFYLWDGANVVAAAGFLSDYLSGPTPYNRKHNR